MKRLLLALALLMTGCSAPSITPNRFVSPEARGRFLSGDVKLAMSGDAAVQFADTDFATSNSASDLNPVLFSSISALAGLDLGLWDRLDFYVDSPSGSAVFPSLKLQVYGEPATTAQAGNVSISIGGGVATGSTSYRPEGSLLTTDVTYSGWEFVSMFGYRSSDRVLFYAEPFWTHLAADAKVHTDAGVTSAYGTPNGNGEFIGSTFGARFGDRFFADLSASATEVNWTRTVPSSNSVSDFYLLFGAALGFAW